MGGNGWMIAELIAPVAGLIVLIALVATAEPDPDRALQRKHQPVKSPSRRRKRSLGRN
ncbi:MAG: hypothetical protein V4444_08885 [Pseudomonadota bacterium]